MINDEEATAYHEAGHAVVAYVLGLSIILVTVPREPQERPRLSTTDLASNQRKRRERTVIAALAAGFAEARYRGGIEEPVLNPLVIAHDLAYARRELCDLGASVGTNVDEEFIRARLRDLATIAKKIVYDYWDGVEALAAELQTRGLLRGPAVRRTLRQAIGKPPREKPY
jgi:hypothetical protein